MFPFHDVIMIHVYYTIRILISTSQLTDGFHLTTHEKERYDALKYWRQDSVDLWDISCFLGHDLYKRHVHAHLVYINSIWSIDSIHAHLSAVDLLYAHLATIVIGGNQNVVTGTSISVIETVSAGGRSHGQRNWAFTPSGGGNMEIQKACLMYNLVTSSVCLRHNYTFYCGLTAVIGEKMHQWTSCGTWLWPLRHGQNSSGFNGCAVEVWEWLSNFTPHIIMDVITYSCWDLIDLCSAGGGFGNIIATMFPFWWRSTDNNGSMIPYISLLTMSKFTWFIHILIHAPPPPPPPPPPWRSPNGPTIHYVSRASFINIDWLRLWHG